MPWFDRGIHPEFRKAEDRANERVGSGPATPGDRIKQALTTPQSAELLEKFKWNPLVAGHARGTLWWETHPENQLDCFLRKEHLQ